MNYQEYQQLFDAILRGDENSYPYTDPAYLHYVRLNQARMRRWDKILHLDEALVSTIKSLDKKQNWIILTEPWCGDAAQSLPYMIALARKNELISYDLQLRDSEPFLIESYLTHGTKSIPKLIVRDEHGNDLFNWGPRPKHAQQIFDELKAVDATHEVITNALQVWYNHDKGVSICAELAALFSK